MKREIINKNYIYNYIYMYHNVTIPCSGVHQNSGRPKKNESGEDFPGRQDRNSEWRMPLLFPVKAKYACN